MVGRPWLNNWGRRARPLEGGGSNMGCGRKVSYFASITVKNRHDPHPWLKRCSHRFLGAVESSPRGVLRSNQSTAEGRSRVLRRIGLNRRIGSLKKGRHAYSCLASVCHCVHSSLGVFSRSQRNSKSLNIGNNGLYFERPALRLRWRFYHE